MWTPITNETHVAFDATLSDIEVSHYTELFQHVDWYGSGVIDADAGIEFIRTGGISQDAAERIWTIADAGGGGSLNLIGWVLVIGMVAQEQSGRQADPTRDDDEVRRIPEFTGYLRSRDPWDVGWEQTSEYGDVPSHLERRDNVSGNQIAAFQVGF